MNVQLHLQVLPRLFLASILYIVSGTHWLASFRLPRSLAQKDGQIRDFRKIFIGSSIIQGTITLSPQSPPVRAFLYFCTAHSLSPPASACYWTLFLVLLVSSTRLKLTFSIYIAVSTSLANVFRSTMITAKLRRNYFCKWSDSLMAHKWCLYEWYLSSTSTTAKEALSTSHFKYTKHWNHPVPDPSALIFE